MQLAFRRGVLTADVTQKEPVHSGGMRRENCSFQYLSTKQIHSFSMKFQSFALLAGGPAQ